MSDLQKLDGSKGAGLPCFGFLILYYFSESLFSSESSSAESVGNAAAQKPGDGQEILQQMKAKFDKTSDRNDRYRILQ